MVEVAENPIGEEALTKPDCDAIKQAIMSIADERGFQIKDLGVTLENDTVHVTGSVHSYTNRTGIIDATTPLVPPGFIQDNKIQVLS